MNDDLFTSLLKYRPREGKDSLENFITEALGWILSNFDEFSKAFTHYLLLRLGLDREINNLAWITQANFDGVYPDMLVQVDDLALIFENKVGSGLSPGQLNSYRNHAKKYYDNYKVILITAYEKQVDQDPDLPLLWSEIYCWINEWTGRQKGELDHVFGSFLKLLSHEGLGPPAPISQESILSYYPAKPLKKRVSDLIRVIRRERDHEWQELIPSINVNPYCMDKRGSLYGEEWGRFGINILGNESSWRPGIFIGFMIDGEDHRIESLLGDRSPDFSIIISFEQDLHQVYYNSPNYKTFINRLSTQIKNLGNHWNFHNHLEQDPNPNRWHPIHIRKPMLEVFRETRTNEDQVERFMEHAKDILKIIFNEGSSEFHKMREEFRRM